MSEVVPARPQWRQQVEQGTALAIGIGTAATAGAVPPDSPAGAVADTVLGLAVEGQRRALDVAEGAFGVGAAVGRFGMRLAPVRALAVRANRSAQPARAHGRAVREVADRVTREAVPRYAAQAARTAIDVVPVDEVVGSIDIGALIDRVDIAALVDRVDVAALIDRVDIAALIDRVDIAALIDRVDITALIDRVDVSALLDRIDVQALIDRVDAQTLIDRIDIEALLDRVDIATIIDRVDVQAIIDRVDIDAVVARVDLETVVDRIDVDTLVERTDLGRIIAQSTGGVASGAVDLVRRQGVGLDSFVARWAARLRPGALGDAPVGPPLLVGDET